MNYRIITTGEETPDVLLHRDRDDEGCEIVELKAIGVINGGEDQFAIEKVVFPNAELAAAFIRDFSRTAAEDFCSRNEITV